MERSQRCWRRKTGDGLACTRRQPRRPGYAKLALASEGRESKTAVPAKEQKTCCGEDTKLGQRSAESAGSVRRRIGFHSTSRITLRRFIRSRAYTTSFLSS